MSTNCCLESNPDLGAVARLWLSELDFVHPGIIVQINELIIMPRCFP